MNYELLCTVANSNCRQRGNRQIHFCFFVCFVHFAVSKTSRPAQTKAGTFRPDRPSHSQQGDNSKTQTESKVKVKGHFMHSVTIAILTDIHAKSKSNRIKKKRMAMTWPIPIFVLAVTLVLAASGATARTTFY